MRLFALLTGLLWAATVVAAPAAWAHAFLISSDPADGAKLTTSPAHVSGTFNEPLQTQFATMTLVGPDGNLWSVGDPVVQGAVIRVDLRPLGPAGRYTVNYRVTSADGHPVTGSWSFELTEPGTGTPGPAAAAPSAERGMQLWVVIAAAVAVVVVAAVAVWAIRRAKQG